MAGIFVIGLSILLGVVAFVALGTLLLVLAAIVGIRVWWFNRKLRKAHGKRQRDGQRNTPGARIDVIEGEYRVVSRDGRRDD